MKIAGKDYILANLEKNNSETINLDLYFRQEQQPVFGVKGKGEVHLAGYFEPEHEEESDEQSDEEKPV